MLLFADYSILSLNFPCKNMSVITRLVCESVAIIFFSLLM